MSPKKLVETPVEKPLGKPRYNPAEAAMLLGIARSRLYERIKEGRITVVKDGRATFITAREIVRYAAEPQPGHERYKTTEPTPS